MSSTVAATQLAAYEGRLDRLDSIFRRSVLDRTLGDVVKRERPELHQVSNHPLKQDVQWSRWTFLPLIRRFLKLQKDFPGNEDALDSFYRKEQEQATLRGSHATTDRTRSAELAPHHAVRAAQEIASLESSIRGLSMDPETIVVRDKKSKKPKAADDVTNKKSQKRKAAGDAESSKKRHKAEREYDAAEFGHPFHRASRDRVRLEIVDDQYWVPRCKYCQTHDQPCHVKRQLRQGATPVCFECAARKSTCSLTLHSKKSAKSEMVTQSRADCADEIENADSDGNDAPPEKKKENLDDARQSMFLIAAKTMKIAEDTMQRRAPAEDTSSRPDPTHRVIQKAPHSKTERRVIVAESETKRLRDEMMKRNLLMSEKRRAEQEKVKARVGPSGIGPRIGSFANEGQEATVRSGPSGVAPPKESVPAQTGSSAQAVSTVTPAPHTSSSKLPSQLAAQLRKDLPQKQVSTPTGSSAAAQLCKELPQQQVSVLTGSSAADAPSSIPSHQPAISDWASVFQTLEHRISTVESKAAYNYSLIQKECGRTYTTKSYDKLADTLHDHRVDVAARLAVIESVLGLDGEKKSTGPSTAPTEAEVVLQQARDRADRIVAAAERRARAIADAVYAQSYSIIAAAHARSQRIVEDMEMVEEMENEMENLEMVHDRITVPDIPRAGVDYDDSADMAFFEAQFPRRQEKEVNTGNTREAAIEIDGHSEPAPPFTIDGLSDLAPGTNIAGPSNLAPPVNIDATSEPVPTVAADQKQEENRLEDMDISADGQDIGPVAPESTEGPPSGYKLALVRPYNLVRVPLSPLEEENQNSPIAERDEELTAGEAVEKSTESSQEAPAVLPDPATLPVPDRRPRSRSRSNARPPPSRSSSRLALVRRP